MYELLRLVAAAAAAALSLGVTWYLSRFRSRRRDQIKAARAEGYLRGLQRRPPLDEDTTGDIRRHLHSV